MWSKNSKKSLRNNMKILGIGVDIIKNERIKRSIKNKNFLLRLFTLIEIKLT